MDEVGFKDVRFSINAGVRVRNRFGAGKVSCKVYAIAIANNA
jgi:hypothetical protein